MPIGTRGRQGATCRWKVLRLTPRSSAASSRVRRSFEAGSATAPPRLLGGPRGAGDNADRPSGEPAAAAVAPAREADWRKETVVDELSQRPITYLSAQSRETVNLAFPYQGEQRAEPVFREHPQHGSEAYLTLERGQIVCPIGRCTVDIAFDDEEPTSWRSTDAADHSSNIVFFRNHARLRRRVEEAREVRVAITLFRQGTHTFTFLGLADADAEDETAAE